MKKIGYLTFYIMIIWTIILLSFFGAVSFEAFVMMLALGIFFLPNNLSLIYVDDINLVNSEFLKPFSKKEIIPLELIKNISIISDWFVGTTTYKILMKDGSLRYIDNKLIKYEREQLRQILIKRGIEVIVI